MPPFFKGILLLYLISTPIGHLDDCSKRVIETLLICDLILCEDTRHSKFFLDHYQIKKPLKSYHKFNEKKELSVIINLLQEGKNIGLITDAGTPCIQDPGALLVKACHAKNIPIRAIPGPCAFAVAISLSGEEQGPFQFIGFLDKKGQALEKQLLGLLDYDGHSLAYVSPHDIINVLTALEKLAPRRELFLVKELTKLFETHWIGTAEELNKRFNEHSPRGEFVLMIKKNQEKEDFSTLSLKDHVQHLESTFDLSTNEAIKLAAKQRGLSKREVYQTIVNEKNLSS